MTLFCERLTAARIDSRVKIVSSIGQGAAVPVTDLPLLGRASSRGVHSGCIPVVFWVQCGRLPFRLTAISRAACRWVIYPAQRYQCEVCMSDALDSRFNEQNTFCRTGVICERTGISGKCGNETIRGECGPCSNSDFIVGRLVKCSLVTGKLCRLCAADPIIVEQLEAFREKCRTRYARTFCDGPLHRAPPPPEDRAPKRERSESQ